MAKGDPGTCEFVNFFGKVSIPQVSLFAHLVSVQAKEEYFDRQFEVFLFFVFCVFRFSVFFSFRFVSLFFSVFIRVKGGSTDSTGCLAT